MSHFQKNYFCDNCMNQLCDIVDNLFHNICVNRSNSQCPTQSWRRLNYTFIASIMHRFSITIKGSHWMISIVYRGVTIETGRAYRQSSRRQIESTLQRSESSLGIHWWGPRRGAARAPLVFESVTVYRCVAVGTEPRRDTTWRLDRKWLSTMATRWR